MRRGNMAGYVLKISRHGDIRRERFDAGDTLGQLQRAVGGLIERVDIPAFDRARLDCDCYVNEEGLFDPDPVLNVAVSEMAGRTIVGDAVLAMHDGAGASYGIPPALCRRIVKYVKGAFAYGMVRRMRIRPAGERTGGNECR